MNRMHKSLATAAAAILSLGMFACATPRHSSEERPRGAHAMADASPHRSAQPDALGISIAELEAEFAEDELLAPESSQVADPFKYWNKIWFHFNDKMYFWVFEPTASGYDRIMPRPARQGVHNFFVNLEAPMRIVNCLFQGRPGQAGEELGRFGLNTTVGVLGFLDPATHWLHMDIHPRDGDQSLAKARIPKGPYLIWPIFGPSTTRGTVGLVMDVATDGGTYLIGSGLIETVNEISLEEAGYRDLVEAAIDPYVAVRSAYIQYRNQKARE